MHNDIYMDTLNSVKDKVQSIVMNHIYITIAVVIVFIIILIVSYKYSPKISKMISGKKSFDISEEELDELIDVIHERQKRNLRSKST